MASGAVGRLLEELIKIDRTKVGTAFQGQMKIASPD